MYLKTFLTLSFFISANLIAVSHNENIAPSTNKPKSFYKKSDSLSADKNLKSNKNTKNKSFLKKYHKPIIIGLTITTVVSLAALTYYVIKSHKKENAPAEEVSALVKFISQFKALSDGNKEKLHNFLYGFQPSPIKVSSEAEQKEVQIALQLADLHNRKRNSSNSNVSVFNKLFPSFAPSIYHYKNPFSAHMTTPYEYNENHVIVKNS